MAKKTTKLTGKQLWMTRAILQSKKGDYMPNFEKNTIEPIIKKLRKMYEEEIGI